MNLKKSPFSIKDKTERDLDNATDFPTLADLMREQNISTDEANTCLLYTSPSPRD